MMTKRSRYGRDMTEDEVEQNRVAVQWGADRRQTDQDDGIPSFDWNHGKNGRIGYRKKRGASTLETKELYSDSQQQAVNMKILESRKRNKEPGANANAGGSQEREESPVHASHYDNSTRLGLEPLGGRHLDLPGRQMEALSQEQLELARRQIDLANAARPPLFGLGGQKYF